MISNRKKSKQSAYLLSEFATYLLPMINNINFNKNSKDLQHTMRKDIDKIIIKTDKSCNHYYVDAELSYKAIKAVATELKIEDIIPKLTKHQTFVTIKEHGDNFL